MPFAKLKMGALSLYPYSNVNNNYITSQKLAWFSYLLLLLLLLLNKDVDINKYILIRLYTLYEFLCRLLYNYSAKSL
jgi:hypothetical protein